jgi:uncharacterized damage-inducible protein DinB
MLKRPLFCSNNHMNFMAIINKTEVWQRGPVAGIPPLLQSVAHALMQAAEEVNVLMTDFPDTQLWEKPGGMASPGFHLQHLTGVLDRIFSYAEGAPLSGEQLEYLLREGVPDATIGTEELVAAFNEQVRRSLIQLTGTDESKLTEFRGVGRKMVPSTVIGLLVHAAEHTMRHLGQLIVTVKWVRSPR